MPGLVIEREILIEAPVEVVWRTLTEPDQMSQWFADRVDLVVEPGAHGYMEFGDQGGPVDGMDEGLAHPPVVQRLDPGVEPVKPHAEHRTLDMDVVGRGEDPAVLLRRNRRVLEVPPLELFVHRVEYFGGLGAEPRQQATTALMAAVAMGGGAAWVPIDRSEREALTLETVKLALELGVDINAVNADGRTALDGAKTLKYDSIVKFLTDKGAKAGTPRKREAPPAEAK